MKGPIFLSASVPYRAPALYVSDPVAVREAVRALVAHVVVQGPLVFGGHPAITPLVWEGARSLNAVDNVYIYQSERFRNLIPREAAFFKNLVWTPAVPKTPPDPNDPFDRQKSLEVMRDLMIRQRLAPDRGITLPEFEAGVFLGGMDGVEEEWDLFQRHYPRAPAYPVASTEGAARLLLDRPNVLARLRPWEELLKEELSYRSVFRELLP
jgi:hypothetical protein